MSAQKNPREITNNPFGLAMTSEPKSGETNFKLRMNELFDLFFPEDGEEADRDETRSRVS